jgi:hypothetical protein
LIWIGQPAVVGCVEQWRILREVVIKEDLTVNKILAILTASALAIGGAQAVTSATPEGGSAGAKTSTSHKSDSHKSHAKTDKSHAKTDKSHAKADKADKGHKGATDKAEKPVS